MSPSKSTVRFAGVPHDDTRVSWVYAALRHYGQYKPCCSSVIDITDWCGLFVFFAKRVNPHLIEELRALEGMLRDENIIKEVQGHMESFSACCVTSN